MTTHSPCFVHHVPLAISGWYDFVAAKLKSVRSPGVVVSDLPWNTSLDGILKGGGGRVFERGPVTGRLGARSWFWCVDG
jgi:hypothetical protein